MLHSLAQLDERLFYWINQKHQNALFDQLMPFLTGSGNWHIPILVTWFALLLFGNRRARVAALLTIPLLALSDQASSNLLKNLFERPRPCATLENVHLLAGCGETYSMPSSHAANFGAAAFHFSLFYPSTAAYWIATAVLVAYTRPYVGVHYPFDCAVGLAVGLCAALVVQMLYRAGRRVMAQHPSRASPKTKGKTTRSM